MARIPYPDLSKVPDHIREMTVQNPYNVARMIAGATPEVFDGYTKLSFALFKDSRLPPDLREIAILRAGYLAKARYETWQHEALARHVGMSVAQIKAVEKGGKHPGILNEAQQAVLDFADDIVLNVRASDATLAAVRKHLSDQLLIDLILVTGLYMTVSRFLETTGVDFDTAPINWKTMGTDRIE